MSGVKRYVTTCECMSEAGWGDYVLAADYDRLEQECERLRSDNLAFARNLRGKHSLTGATYEHLIAERDSALKQVEGLRAALMEADKGVHWLQANIPMSRKEQRHTQKTRADIDAALQAPK